jgi:chromosome segregation ATPase
MEVETIKKTQTETNLEIEILEKKSGTCEHHQQEMEERISGAEDSIENMDTTIKKNCKKQKAPNSEHRGNPDTMRRPNPKDNRYR